MLAVQIMDRGTYHRFSTVWRAVATGERWLRGNRAEGSQLLPSGGCCQEYLHRLANGGYGGTVATAKGGYEAGEAKKKTSRKRKCLTKRVLRNTTKWRIGDLNKPLFVQGYRTF